MGQGGGSGWAWGFAPSTILLGAYVWILFLFMSVYEQCNTGPFLHIPKLLWLDYVYVHNCVYYDHKLFFDEPIWSIFYTKFPHFALISSDPWGSSYAVQRIKTNGKPTSFYVVGQLGYIADDGNEWNGVLLFILNVQYIVTNRIRIYYNFPSTHSYG